MATKQVQKLLGQLIEHQDAFDDMSSEDRQWIIGNTKTAISLFGASIRHYAHGPSSDFGSLDDVVRSEFITVLAEFEASAVSTFDVARHFRDGRNQAARSSKFPNSESDVPTRTLKVLRLKGRGDLPLQLIYALGYNPLVYLAHVYEFGKAWDQGEVKWFGKKPKDKSLGFVVRVDKGLSVNCAVNRAHDNADLSKDWFLGCKYQPFKPNCLKQAQRYNTSLIMVN